jgi:DNA repair photolyase
MIARATETLRARIERWLAPLRAPGALPRGFHVDEVETEQGLTLWLKSGQARLRVELERADRARPCFATTEVFNVYYDDARREGDRGSASERDAAEVVDAIVQIVRAHERELEASPGASDGRADVREVEVDKGLVREGDTSQGAAYYANPYVGCMLGCQFCYAIHRAELSRALDGRPDAPWGKYVDVKINLPEVVAREVQTLPPGTVRMSPIVTDPYQPIERRYRITRGVLRALAGTDFTPIVLTRASLVCDDVPLLASFPRAYLGVSVPTDDDEVRRAFEPATEAIAARIATLRAAREAGLVTFAIVQPMLPLDPARLVELLSGLVEVVRIGPLFEKERALPLYRALGLAEAPSAASERATFEELRGRFEARGVRVNPDDEAWSFLRG